MILAFGAAKGIESVSDVVYGQFQQHERMDKIAISMMIKGAIALGALGSATALTGRTAVGDRGSRRVLGDRFSRLRSAGGARRPAA